MKNAKIFVVNRMSNNVLAMCRNYYEIDENTNDSNNNDNNVNDNNINKTIKDGDIAP